MKMKKQRRMNMKGNKEIGKKNIMELIKDRDLLLGEECYVACPYFLAIRKDLIKSVKHKYGTLYFELENTRAGMQELNYNVFFDKGKCVEITKVLAREKNLTREEIESFRESLNEEKAKTFEYIKFDS